MKKPPPRFRFDGMDGGHIDEIPGDVQRAWISDQSEGGRRLAFLQRFQGGKVQHKVSNRTRTNNDYLQVQTTNPMKSTMGAALDEYALDFDTMTLVQ